MKTQSRFSALASLLLVASASTGHAATIVNGSFETPFVTPGTFDTYGNGSTSITGWTVVGFETAIVGGPFVSLPMVYQAQNGAQFMDLTGNASNAPGNGISQSIATDIGQLYALSFYVGSGTDVDTFTSSTVDLSINGGARVSFTNPAVPTTSLDWQLFTFNFTASGTLTDITFFNGSAPSNNLSALDNVSIAAVPEPSAFALVAGVLALGGTFVRRRRRS